MKRTITRRQFVKESALAAGVLSFPFVSVRNVLGANERLNIGGIGAGGKGAVDLGYCATENIVALCDVDERQAAATFRKFPKARRYKDFRVLLEKEANHIDAVTVSTPDHVHAFATLMAMRMGKNVYCQKPLTHSVGEARIVTEVARQQNVVTQMGNQGHCHPGSRRLVELIQAGVLGKVREIHVWTDRPIWPQGMEQRPAETPAPPPTLDWDLWLGPSSPYRPYNPAYLPFKWRGWWEFGCGALGDMACHNMDLSFFSLGLRDPVSVKARTSGATEESPPKWSIIAYNFPADGERPAVTLTWYDGGKRPSPELAKQKELPGNGTIMVGDKDTLFVPNYWGPGTFVSGATMEDYKDVPYRLPRWPGGEKDNDRAHHQEWIAACKGMAKALSNFDYAGPMTEAVLLGNVAIRAGRKIEWDARTMRLTNAPDAEKYIHLKYRKGWVL